MENVYLGDYVAPETLKKLDRGEDESVFTDTGMFSDSSMLSEVSLETLKAVMREELSRFKDEIRSPSGSVSSQEPFYSGKVNIKKTEICVTGYIKLS